MFKVFTVAALGLVLMAAQASADSIDEAEAKKRGVTVEHVQLERAQARIAELEAEVAELKAGGKVASTPPSVKPTAPAGKKSRADLPEYLQHYLKFRDKSYEDELGALKINAKSERVPTKAEEYSKRLRTLVVGGQSSYVPTMLIAPQVGDGGNQNFAFKVLQVLGDDSALVDIGETTFLLKGVSFKNVSDDSTVKFDTPLIATKTTKYDTVTGAGKTVVQLEPFKPSDYKDY